MSFQSFKGFPKLPVELRLMIWSIAIDGDVDGRIIRVERKTNGRFHMSGGQTPKWLWLCKDSREAALKVFPYLDANGDAPETESFERIWVNFHIDTLYVIDRFKSQNCLEWLRDVAHMAKPNHAEAINVVRHLAFDISQSYHKLFCADDGMSTSSGGSVSTPLAYKLCASHHSLKTIALVDDRSKFKIARFPDQYHFAASPALARYGESWCLYRAVTQIKEHYFNLKSSAPGIGALEMRRQQQPQFVIPDFPVCGINKSRRRN